MINDRYFIKMFNRLIEYKPEPDKAILHVYRGDGNNFVGFDIIIQNNGEQRLLSELDTACPQADFNNLIIILDDYFGRHIYQENHYNSYYEWELDIVIVNKFIMDNV